MTTPKRLEQKRLAAKKLREKKKEQGLIRWELYIKPEWRKMIMELIKRLERERKNAE